MRDSEGHGMVMKSETRAMKCSSCGTRIENQKNWVEFGCPRCGKAEIIRCEKCRKTMNVYECPDCNFQGP